QMGVMAFHGEMTFGDRAGSGQAVRRHISDIGYHLYGESFPTYSAIKRKSVSFEQMEMVRRVVAILRDIPLVGQSVNNLTVPRLRSMARRQIQVWDRRGIRPGLIAIDHVGLMAVDGRSNGKTQDQGAIIQGIKSLAKEVGVPILALAQISRGISQRDDKRPMLSDLKDSGELENSA